MLLGGCQFLLADGVVDHLDFEALVGRSNLVRGPSAVLNLDVR